MERWAVQDDFIFHLISERKLFPSIFLNDHFDKYIFNYDEAKWTLDYSTQYLEDFADDEEMLDRTWEATKLRGFYFLKFHRESLEHCSADEVAKKTRNEEEIWHLGFSVDLNLGEIHFNGDDRVVFITSEIYRFEKENATLLDHLNNKETPITTHISNAPPNEIGDSDRSEPFEKQEKLEKPLINRERNNLLKVIAALCKEQNLPLEKPFKAAEIIKNQLKNLDLNLSDDTIARFLNDAQNLLKRK